MLTGLIIGKFMPLTCGHIGLIEFGLKNCDELIIAVCSHEWEIIEGETRYQWVKKYFENNERVNVVQITEDLPGSSESNREVSKIWANYLKQLYPQVNIIFASEKYGDYLAEYMGIESRIYDIDRKNTPISATMVRENPYKYWDFIPDIVKPYYVKKICVFGPDSCGKSTLAIDLAKHYKTAYVPEIARNMFEWSELMIDDININHLEQFAKLQHETVNSMIYFANKILICDTDNITTQIYSEVYCGEITEDIKKYNNVNYDLYIFLDIDTEYIEEEQRNLKNRRKEMRQRFIDELQKRDIEFILINGTWQERFIKAVKAIDEIIFKNEV